MIIIVFNGCDEVNSTLINPYDVDSPIYTGYRPEIIGIQSIENNKIPEKMYNSFVKIIWKDSSSHATGYLIECSTDNANFFGVGSVDKNTFSFVDTCSDITPFRFYRVITKTATNISLPSNSKKVSVVCNLKIINNLPYFHN